MRATGLEKADLPALLQQRGAGCEAFDYAWRETLDARIHDLDTISNTVDRLKQLVANFVERRGIFPAVSIAQHGVDTMTKFRSARASTQGLAWLAQLPYFDDQCRIKAREIRPRVDTKKLATHHFFPRGCNLLYRLERNEEALRAVQAISNLSRNRVRVPSK